MPVTTYTTIQGEIVSENRNGVKRDYVPDPLGNTVALLDANQQKTDTFSYWPYGELKSRTGTTPTPMQYVGTQGYYRDKLERVYVRARHLRPSYGRWSTVDPVHIQHGNANRYLYAQNSPLTYVDPSGRWVHLLVGAVVVIIVVIVVVHAVGGCRRKKETRVFKLPDQSMDCSKYPEGCRDLCRGFQERPPRLPSESAVILCCQNLPGTPDGTPQPSMPFMPTLPANEAQCWRVACDHFKLHGYPCQPG